MKKKMSENTESSGNVQSTDKVDQYINKNDDEVNSTPAVSPSAKIPKMVRHFKYAEDRRLPWCLLPKNIESKEKLKSFESYMHFIKKDRYERACSLLCMKECPIANPVLCSGNILDDDIIFISDDSKQRTKNYKISNRLIKDRFVIADTTISRRVLRRRRENDDDPERDNNLKMVCVEEK